MDINDIPRIVKEAFYLARTGRPGPVLIDVPKDVQQMLAVPDWDSSMAITGYMDRLPSPPGAAQIASIVDALHEAKKPVSGCTFIFCQHAFMKWILTISLPFGSYRFCTVVGDAWTVLQS